MPRTYSYSRFAQEQLELRDYLALERTILSNERTLLSYSQHALTLIAAGATTMFAVESFAFFVGGAFLVALGLTIGTFGIVRFFRVKRRLDEASPAVSADVAAEAISSARAEQA